MIFLPLVPPENSILKEKTRVVKKISTLPSYVTYNKFQPMFVLKQSKSYTLYIYKILTKSNKLNFSNLCI